MQITRGDIDEVIFILPTVVTMPNVQRYKAENRVMSLTHRFIDEISMQFFNELHKNSLFSRKFAFERHIQNRYEQN